ncbi:DUF4879 domain-containing protein [Shewanella sp.]|uniref:DUF4879 domain-containing protein n=1 Tax=Shewanella sp. TaxID=50422 RepID=UPI001EC3FF7C|nr:DUF4879 domain-containing protein [Shewanella sp.]NRB25919.1 DUF4879 domain-containing protein [Shewanella sp.]
MKTIKVCFALALLSSAANVSANDSDILSVVEELRSSQEYQTRIEKIKENSTELQENYKLYIESIDKNDELVNTMGPAPALNSAEILAVTSTSTNYRWEHLTERSYSTNKDHGGIVYIAVIERGYARSTSRQAKINAMPMKFEMEVAIKRGNTVVGFEVYYSYQNFVSGTAKSQATSLVYPYSTIRDRVYIR